MSYVQEELVEGVALGYFRDLGYQILHGNQIAPGADGQERASYADVVLVDRLAAAVAELNPDLPARVVEQVVAAFQQVETANLLTENARFHKMITDGVELEYRDDDGHIRTPLVRVVDFDDPDRNDYLVVQQFTVTEGRRKRRADIVVFVNGLALAVVELKNPGDENATVHGAYQQLQTYKHDVPRLFWHNALLVASDGLAASAGSLSADWEHVAPWKSIDSMEPVEGRPELDVLVHGIFDRRRLLDLVQNFIVFSDEPAGLVKRVAKYHQFWGVNAAVDSTVLASSEEGDGRAGVVWHTQGSGKSLEMLFYARKVMRHPAMGNPTLVLVTDRNDLDDQLYEEVFAPARNLPETPVQADTRDQLRDLLRRASGGIIFTTVQKFALTREERGRAASYPQLSDRRNIVVVADEAHRTQYGFVDGFARNVRDALPNASYIGFTGTPLELDDRDTRQVFGDYVSTYDISRAVKDGATVKLYYESRLAKVLLSTAAETDAKFDEATEGATDDAKQRLKSKYARQSSLLGAPSRVRSIAGDIVTHWRQRLDVLDGKAMIVTASRSIAVDLYNAIIDLVPDWHDDADDRGTVKVVISGDASDPADLQPHIRTKQRMRELKERAKDPADPLRIVIVCDMWLTGFDSPSMHTMYIDKPLKGHTLMQAIARVNRTWRDKPAGVIVDYIGLADELRAALRAYSPADRASAGVPVDAAVAALLEKHDVVTTMLHDVDWSHAFAPDPATRLDTYKAVVDHIVADEDRKKRFITQSLALQKAFALAVPDDRALALRDDVGFFQAVRSQILKLDSGGQRYSRTDVAMDTAVKQILSEAVTVDAVVDIYAEAGVERPELSILSDEFLEGLKHKPQPHLQLEALRKLLNDEIRALAGRNLVQQRRFSEMLQGAVLAYQNRAITTAEVIAELVELAKEMRDAHQRGDELGLADDELAFYDAVYQNDSAVLELGDDTLRTIALELAAKIREDATIDWTVKETVRARMRSGIKRLLLRHRYPPDKAESAIDLVLAQAEQLAEKWAA